MPEKELNRDIQKRQRKKKLNKEGKTQLKEKNKQKETDKDRKKRHVGTELVKPRGQTKREKLRLAYRQKRMRH